MGFFSKYFGSREATTVADYEREVRQERQASAQNLKEPRKMGEAKVVSASDHLEHLYGASADNPSEFWENSAADRDHKLTITMLQAQKSRDLIQTLATDLEDQLDELPSHLEKTVTELHQKTTQALLSYYTYNAAWEINPQNPELAEYYFPGYHAACDTVKVAYRCLQNNIWNTTNISGQKHEMIRILSERAQDTAQIIPEIMPTVIDSPVVMAPSDAFLISVEERQSILKTGQRVAQEAIVRAQHLAQKAKSQPETGLYNLALAYESGASDLVLALENYADCARESQLLHVDFVTAFRQVVRILRETSGDEQYVHILEYLARLESISIRALEDYSLADDADTVLYLLDLVQSDVPEQTFTEILGCLLEPYRRYLTMLLTQWDIYALGNFAPLMVATYAMYTHARICYEEALAENGNTLQAWSLAHSAHEAIVMAHRYAYTDYREMFQDYDEEELDALILQNMSENTREFFIQETEQMANAWKLDL